MQTLNPAGADTVDFHFGQISLKSTLNNLTTIAKESFILVDSFQRSDWFAQSSESLISHSQKTCSFYSVLLNALVRLVCKAFWMTRLRIAKELFVQIDYFQRKGLTGSESGQWKTKKNSKKWKTFYSCRKIARSSWLFFNNSLGSKSGLNSGTHFMNHKRIIHSSWFFSKKRLNLTFLLFFFFFFFKSTLCNNCSWLELYQQSKKCWVKYGQTQRLGCFWPSGWVTAQKVGLNI